MSRRRAGGIVGLLVVLGLVGYLLLSPPSALTALLTGDRPSAIAGQEVPAIAGTPDVRIAVAGDTETGHGSRAHYRRTHGDGG